MRNLWETATHVSKTATADVDFRRQNSDQRETRPLAPPERSEELESRVLQGGLYAINGRSWQWNHLPNKSTLKLRGGQVKQNSEVPWGYF